MIKDKTNIDSPLERLTGAYKVHNSFMCLICIFTGEIAPINGAFVIHSDHNKGHNTIAEL